MTGLRRWGKGQGPGSERAVSRGLTRARRARLGAGLLAGLLALSWLLTSGPASAAPDPYCYLVNGQADFSHNLTWVNWTDFNAQTNETTIGATGTRKTDSIALQPVTGVLYGVDTNVTTGVGYIGTFNLSTGAFTRLPQSIGTASGSLGSLALYDVSGLTFDPASGILYATHVRFIQGQNLPDVLFQVDLSTGHFIANAFGSGKDYVVLNPLPAFPNLSDVDDIAIDPADGQMYGIVNNSSSGDRLVKINKASGALTDVGPFGVAEVEGLDFDPSGQLWATAGSDSSIPNKLYQVNKANGQATNPRTIDNSYNYEALACMVSQPAPNRPTATPTATRTATPPSTPQPTANPRLTRHVYLPFISAHAP